jgi:BASS family bile acid:Na+ symporter
MFLSYWSANRIVKDSTYDAITIGIEVGLQNTTLALLVATVMIGDEQMAEPTLVYAMFSFFTTLGFGFLAKRSADRGAKNHNKKAL